MSVPDIVPEITRTGEPSTPIPPPTRTHPTTTELDSYLHREMSTHDAAALRGHLDHCSPCWRHWNRHRWDTAAAHPLLAQLRDFLGDRYRHYFDSSTALAAEWDTADPRTATQIAEFFRTSTSYLYNLTIWEASGNRPLYTRTAIPFLRDHAVRTVLDYGCGIGSDSLPFSDNGFTVTACDFDSPSTQFLRFRTPHPIPVIEPDEHPRLPAPDALWIIDTLDHLPDPETALGSLLRRVRVVVTEDLTDCRGHGRQRFHYRRSFEEIAELLARHGLSVATRSNHCMFWLPNFGTSQSPE